MEVVAHLNDAELVHGHRTRMIVAEREPAIIGYDQDGWALAFGYAHADLKTTLAMLTAMREANLRLWSAFTPAQLARVGHHSERGPESAGAVPEAGGGSRPGASTADRADPGESVNGDRDAREEEQRLRKQRERRNLPRRNQGRDVGLMPRV